jgi:IclR family pca regulon transcriptional regulator
VSRAHDSSDEGDGLRQSELQSICKLRISESLQRGLELLQVFSSESPVLRLSDIASEIGLTRPTARRYARTLVQMGFLQQDAKNKYLLAPRAADPGLSLIATMRRALPVLTVLEELRDETGYTVGLGVMRHHSATYVHRLFGHRCGQYEIDLELRAGARIPLYCTALGKALLATFPDEWRQWLIKDINLVPQGPRSIIAHGELIDDLRRIDLQKPVISDEEFIAGGRLIAMYVPRPDEKRPIGIDISVPSAACTVGRLRLEIGRHIEYAAKLISQAEPNGKW